MAAAKSRGRTRNAVERMEARWQASRAKRRLDYWVQRWRIGKELRLLKFKLPAAMDELAELEKQVERAENMAGKHFLKRAMLQPIEDLAKLREERDSLEKWVEGAGKRIETLEMRRAMLIGEKEQWK